jgi:hypothetical protein
VADVTRSRRLLAFGATGLLALAVASQADTPLLIAPAGSAPTPRAPWYFVGLPHQTKPATRFTAVDLDGQRVLRIEADHAYGNLVHPLAGVPAGTLAWRWRVDEPVLHADLRRKAGDDAAAKVCAVFDMPDSRVPFFERQVLHLAELRAGEHLPAATLCYVWDMELPAGTVLHNAFTHRLRFIVVHGTPHEWTEERHDLAADFLRAFGDESPSVPALSGIAIGADSDNTASHSVAYVDALTLLPK